MEMFWVFSDPKFNACTRSLFHSPWSKHLITSSFTLSRTTLRAVLADTIGRILQTDAQKHGDKAQMLPDSLKSWQRDAEMQGVVPAEGAWRDHSRCKGCELQNEHWWLFLLFAFVSIKAKILFEFLPVSEKVLMLVFHKSKVVKRKLWESGETCTTWEHGH